MAISASSGFRPSNIATLIEAIADATPERVHNRAIQGSDSYDTFRDVTWAQLRRASNRASFWLDQVLGKSQNFDSFVFYGRADVSYAIAVIAAAKTQRLILVLDGNLKQEALVNTMKEHNCSTWIGTAGFLDGAEALKADKFPELDIFTFPDLDSLLEGAEVPVYPYNKPWQEAAHDPHLVLHTSGTTGLPKSCVYRHANNAVMNIIEMNRDGSPIGDGRQNALVGATMIWAPRPWWLGGLCGLIHWPFFHGVTSVIAPDISAQPTAEWAIGALENCTVDGTFFNPSLTRDVCLEERGVQLLKKLKFVVYAGAPLDTWVGDLLCEHTELTPFIGSTEMELLWLKRPADPRDWKYYEFEACTGVRMDPDPNSDGLFELVVERRPELQRFQGTFATFPHLDEYRSQDLYAPHPHPAKKSLWLYSGRADDTFRLRWFTRVKHTEIESELERHGRISRAMVGGEGRPDPFVVVEMTGLANGNGVSGVDGKAVEEEVWAIVSEVNGRVKAEAQIPRSNIIVADPKKPLRRTTKGGLNRRVINEEYKDEIEQVYRK